MNFPRPAALLLLALLAAPAGAENLRLAVYHTSDIHGWIASRPAGDSYKADPSRRVGGAAALAALLKRETGPRLLLDAGDWFQGTPEGYLGRGEALVATLNALDYDAVGVGNHDFDYGEKRLRELTASLKMPVLGANVRREKDHKRVDWLKPWIVKKVAGVKVGVFGLITANMKVRSFPESIAGLEFRREVDEAKDAVRELKAQGATVIIAVTHIGIENKDIAGFEGDQTLAAEVPGIDLIVGGHSHQFLRTPLRDPIHGTLIVQAGTGLTVAGKVSLEVDPATGRVVSSTGSLVDLWVDELGEEPKVKAIVDAREAEADRAFAVVVATASSEMKRELFAESALGDWVADCEREWGGTDVGLMNGPGLRAGFRAGPVTLRSLFDVMPFDNRMAKVTLKGSLLAAALDGSTSRKTGLVQVSGMSFSYDRDKPAGQKIADLKIGGKPVSPDAVYTLATNDFVVRGGIGPTLYGQADKTEFAPDLLRDVLRGCAEKQGVIKTPASGRMLSMEAANGAQERPR